MVYIFENLHLCDKKWLAEKEQALPAWRQTKVQLLKKEEDKIRSVVAFLLLKRALEDLGISPVPEFAYEPFGKPYLPGCPVHFSISHTKNAVACSVRDCPVGLDVQDEMAFSARLAKRICNEEELSALERAKDRGLLLTTLWTKKEALAKCNGKGLGERFSSLEEDVFTLYRPGYCLSVTEENPRICVLNEL